MPTFPVRIGQKDNIDSTSDFGPHLISGAWYVVNKETNSSCDIYKSVDSGVTWAVQDALALNAGKPYDVLWDIPNGKIYAIRPKGATTTTGLCSFDLATDLWDPIPASNGPVFTPGIGIDDTFQARMVQVASGDIWLFYAEKIAADPEFQLNYIINSGGVWGSPNILVVASPGLIANYLQAAIVDSGNLMHVFYKQNNTGTDNSGNLYHVSITVGGVISAPTLIDTNLNFSSAGRPSILGTSIILPYFDNNRLAGVFEGTPLATPVWGSFTLVDTNNLGAGVVDDGFGSLHGNTSFSFVDSGVVYLVWQSTNSDGSYAINRIYYSSKSISAWATPILLYDEVADPAPWLSGNNPDLYAMSANVIGGNILVVSNINCMGMAFSGEDAISAPPDTLMIVCNDPPPGQVGVPY